MGNFITPTLAINWEVAIFVENISASRILGQFNRLVDGLVDGVIIVPVLKECFALQRDSRLCKQAYGP